MPDEGKENLLETKAWTSPAARTSAVSHALDKGVQAAQNLTEENDAKLLVKAIDTSLRAVLVADSARDAFLLLRNVKAHFKDEENRAIAPTADIMTCADNVDRTECTAAAITATIKAAHNQKTEQSSKFLVEAVEASVRAVEGEDTVAYSQFIIAAVKAAVPDDTDAAPKNRVEKVEERRLDDTNAAPKNRVEKDEERSVGNENVAPILEQSNSETPQKHRHMPHVKVPKLMKKMWKPTTEGFEHAANVTTTAASLTTVAEACMKED